MERVYIKRIKIMTQIHAEKSKGRSRHSLLEAIFKATATCIKKHDGGPASVNLIVEGYEFDGEDYVAKVRVMIMPHDLETDNLYHEKDATRHNRQEEGEDIATGFMAASYDIGLYDSVHDEVLHALQGQIQDKICMDGKVILIASDDVHDMLRKEVKERNMTKENNLDLQALELGAGSSTSRASDDRV
jgi:hypothetical protein